MANCLKIAMLAPITWRVPPRAYGPWERVVYNLTETLVKMGHKVTLFASGDSKSSAKLESIIKKPLGKISQPNPKVWEHLHIANVFEKANHFDIIHNHLNYLPLTYSKMVKTPVLTTLHGAVAHKETHPVFLQYKSSNFVSVSNFERSYLPQLNYLATIYNGINLKTFSLAKSHGNYLVYTGRLAEEKGVLKAIKLSLKTKIPLYLAGIIQPSVKGRKFFEKQVRPHIDGENIKFLGNLSQKKVAQLVSKALAYVFLIKESKKGEACPLSVVETLACGTPVIATKNGPLPEMIEPGVAGFLVNSLKEAIAKLEQIKKLDRREIRILAKEKFSQEKMTKDYLECYERLIRKTRSQYD